VARARADFDAISRVARAFSSPVDETPALVAAQLAGIRELEKTVKRLSSEAAQSRGRELHASTQPGPGGLRRVLQRSPAGPLSEETRLLGQSFAAAGSAVFIGVTEQPPSVLYCVSEDSGIHAGNVLKAALAAAGGRGGGNAQVAQGSVPSPEALARVLVELGGSSVSN
jgi:alanyl-tRNA synthetase